MPGATLSPAMDTWAGTPKIQIPHADVFSACPFGLQHGRLRRGKEVEGAIGFGHSANEDGVSIGIGMCDGSCGDLQANCDQVKPKGEAVGSGVVHPWLTEAGAKNLTDAYRCSFAAKKRLYTERELICAFGAFATRREEEKRRNYHARWKAIFSLQTLLESDGGRPFGSPPIRLAGGDRTLYELMFRAEPRTHVSRSTFLTVMRRVYGFRIAPIRGTVDRATLHILSEFYKTFDADGDGRVDWRCMLFMLRAATNAQATVDANLKWGFALYSSPGSFDPACEDPVSMADFKKLLCTLARLPCIRARTEILCMVGSYGVFLHGGQRYDKREELVSAFDEAWKAVAGDDGEARQLEAAQISELDAQGRQNNLKITIRLLRLILKQGHLHALFKPATRFGDRDNGVWTYAIEEAFYEPLLVALLKKRRRDLRNDMQIAIFLSNTRQRTFQVHMTMWKSLVGRRKRCRLLMLTIGGRFSTGNSSTAFRLIRRLAFASKAAENIQRFFRGHMGRQLANFVRDVVWNVIKTQAAYRGMRQRRRFLCLVKAKHLAATSIQKIARGTIGRKIARCRLQEYFDREMAMVDEEVERLEYRRRHKAASKLQRLWRARRNERLFREEKLRRIKAHEAEAAMDLALAAQAREAAVYKRELVAWYKQQRKEQEDSRVTEEQTAKEKFKILLYRRRERDRVAAETKRRKLAAAEKFEEQRIERWQKDWADKAEERAAVHRKMLEAVLKNPDTPPEKILRRKLQAEIEVQKKAVLRMADSVEADLEAPEALTIAREDVLLKKMEEERERVREEMKAAATAYLEAEATAKADKEEKMGKYRDTVADAAARTIQQMYYVFDATRATQKRAQEVYTKHFDVATLAYYWYNTQIGTFLWKKPHGLGGWDVDPDDRWEAIEGSFSLHYYYNPRTYVMQWTKPFNTVVCAACDVQFCTRWCNRDLKPYCEACYFDRHFSYQQSTGELTYKDLDGAAAGAADQIKYDYISDCPDIPVETRSYVGNDASGQDRTDAVALPKSTVDLSAAYISAVDGTTGYSQFSTGEELTPGVEQDHQLDDIREYLQSQDRAFFSYERQVDGGDGENSHIHLTTGELVKAPEEQSGKADCKVECVLDQSAMEGGDDNGCFTGECNSITLVGRDQNEEHRESANGWRRGRQVEQPEWFAGIVYTRNDSSYTETGAATYDIDSEEVSGRMELS